MEAHCKRDLIVSAEGARIVHDREVTTRAASGQLLDFRGCPLGSLPRDRGGSRRGCDLYRRKIAKTRRIPIILGRALSRP